MDYPAPVGCVLTIRLIDTIEAQQREDGDRERDDRPLAVPPPRARSSIGNVGRSLPQVHHPWGAGAGKLTAVPPYGDTSTWYCDQLLA